MNTINSNILVTGASGSLGRELIKKLSENGYTNITACYCNNVENLPSLSGVKWKKLDILDIIALEDMMLNKEILIHLAGIVSYQPRDKSNILKINIEGTANVVNAANASSIKKLIHISSTAALGVPTETQLLGESYLPDPTQFITDYALSKWYGELEVWRAISEGLNAIIVSPSIIINPEDKNANTAIFKNRIKEGLTYSPTGSSGFIHVGDVAKAIILLIENDIQEKKLILNASNLSWNSFFNIIANNLGINTKFKTLSPFIRELWMFINRMNNLFAKKVYVPTAMAKNMEQNLAYDGRRITEVLPFSYTEIEEAIREYCN